MDNFLYILLALGLVFLNGFFVAAEFAVVKIRHSRLQALQEKEGYPAKILAQIHRKMDAYLSACQFGITLTSLGLGWIGEPAVGAFLLKTFKGLSFLDKSSIHILAFSIGFAVISYVHIVLGELVPKSMAIRQAEKVAIWTAVPLYLFYLVMYPFIMVLNWSARVPLMLFRWNVDKSAEPAYSSEELTYIVKASHLHGEFTKSEADIIEQTMEFTDLQVSDVMRPIEELVALDEQQPIEANLQKMAQHRYSRYPIYRGQLQNILGVVHAKEVFSRIQQQGSITSFKDLLRPLIRTEPQDSVMELLQDFKEGGNHMALIFREERLVGFVTLDNLLQVIVGRIRDEFHLSKQDWVKLDEENFQLAGHASIYVLEHLADVDLTSESVSTVNELMSQYLGRTLHLLDRVEFESFDLQVAEMVGPRVSKIVLTLKKTGEGSDENAIS